MSIIFLLQYDIIMQQQIQYSSALQHNRPTIPNCHPIRCKNSDTAEMRKKRQARQCLDLQFKKNHVALHERPTASRAEESKNVAIPFERLAMTPLKAFHPYQTPGALPIPEPRYFLSTQRDLTPSRTPNLTKEEDLHANMYNNFSQQTRLSVKRQHFDMTQRHM